MDAALRTVALLSVRCDPDVQPRAEMSTETITDYAERMAAGDTFPPLVLFEDAEGTLWLADGFHRVGAAMSLGLAELTADVRPGGKRDALLYAVGANAAHGLRRTKADKRKAVFSLLADPTIWKWTNPEIARQCGVDQSFVYRLRNEVRSTSFAEQRIALDEPRQVRRGEQVYEMKPPTEWARPAPVETIATPPQPIRERTVRDVAPVAPLPADAYPESEARESIALRHFQAAALDLMRFSPEHIAETVDPSTVVAVMGPLERLSPWFEELADRLRARESPRLRRIR